MTAANHAAQFPDDMITQGNDMLYTWCWAVVNWEATSYAWFLPIGWQHWLHRP